ncbi:hypothetical protein [Marinomonas vulgaris]|nr:hypothetical protein [Marinomonas vulgaris]
MKSLKYLLRPAFLLLLVFSVSACVMMPGGGPHGHSGGGAGTSHR